MKKTTPIWLKFFVISVVLLFALGILLLTLYITDIKERELRLTDDNLLMNMHYTETNVNNFLENHDELIGSVNLVGCFYDAEKKERREYRREIQQKMKDIYSESSRIIAIFYQDMNYDCFSVGELFLSFDKQMEMIDECKSAEEYIDNNELWFYKSIGRNFNSIVLCKDLVYVDEDYHSYKLGTIVVYFDADKFSNTFFYNNQYNTVVVVDSFGNIVLSNDSQIVGKSYDIYTKEKEMHNICLKIKKMNYSGWKIVSSIENGVVTNAQRVNIVRFIFLMLGVLLFVSIVFYFLSKRLGKPIDALNNDLKKEKKLNLEMQLMLQDAKIKTYEQQMNPHFLFNTLNMMSMMNVVGKKNDVAQAITSLGDLLRFNLDKRSQVTFREEIDNAMNYLKIIELRFKKNFCYSIIFPDELMDCYTIKFIIQPLIENAIKHGFKNRKKVCEIVIIGQVIHDELVIIIQDNGQGIEKERLAELREKLIDDLIKDDGIGLVNVNERIRLVYGAKYGINIFSEHEKHTQILIHMPVCKSMYERGEQDV